MRRLLLLASLLTVATAQAQFELQDSTATADLRGIVSVGNGTAWASGNHGTVLRTEDSGFVWQGCTTPPGAENLDFRGIQAFDDRTAIVMSSGKGNLSRIYKTTDGCLTWKLVFTNPDPEGFFDALDFLNPALGPSGHSLVQGYVLGDPVGGTFALFQTLNSGDTWSRKVSTKRGSKGEGCKADAFASKNSEAVFAASNQSLISFGTNLIFVTGGSVTRFAYTNHFDLDFAFCHDSAAFITLPMEHGSPSSGAFAVAAEGRRSFFPLRLMIVGGDYQHPDSMQGNSTFISSRDGFHVPFSSYFDLVTASTPPHGYRSSVAYDLTTKTWITVGPNGTDISTDDGRNWKPLRPTKDDAPDADRNWNALSLPFVVGPHGRIGRLRDNALMSH